MEDKNKKLYIIVSIIIIAIVSISIALFIQSKNNKIVKNVYIENINVGGMTRAEASKKLKESFKEKNITLKFENKNWDVDYKDFNFNYNIEKTIDDVYEINKGNNIANNIIETAKAILGNDTKVNIEMNYDNKKLESIINDIAKDINKKSENATIDINGDEINITSEKMGAKVNVAETLKNIKSSLEKHNFICEIVTTKDKPNITKLKLENINTILGSYSTNFNGGISGRNQNIKLAAQRTSDILLMPGESFSYNTYTKKRTLSNGYKNAPVIVQGVVQEGIGGGVCQVSTTLYNATLYAGLEYMELRNHSIPSSYAPKGRDATVADGSIDFVFKNNLKYPIYIKNTVNGNTVTCQIYGSSKDKKDIEILTSTDEVSVAPIKKVDDPSLENGKEKVLEKGRDGYIVSTYRIYKDNNGNIIEKEKVSKSYYPKKQGVVAVGTKEDTPKLEDNKEESVIQPDIQVPEEKPEVKPVDPTTPPVIDPESKPEQELTPEQENKPEDQNNIKQPQQTQNNQVDTTKGE
ncbi:VanW family protein [Paraclostridium bifermentans]